MGKMKTKYFKAGKIHFQVGMNEIIHSQKTPVWDMSYDKNKVTCKRCLRKMMSERDKNAIKLGKLANKLLTPNNTKDR